jgi:bifunctional ADP-heptose synthase (sugar kinase/adenylyltransferase)
MWLLGPDGETALSTEAREVADVTGAGDTVIGTLALGLAAGGTLLDAARLANRAAGIVVGKFGPATASLEELSR